MFELIINDLIGTTRFLPYAFLDGIIVLLIVYYVQSFRGKERLNSINYLSIFIFSVYIAAIVYITILSRPPGSRDEVDLILFETLGNTVRSRSYVFENILLFIPFGILLPLVNGKLRKFSYCIIIGFLFSLMIEVVQMITKRGYFQLDDIMTNVLGTVIGYTLCWIIVSLNAKN